jgi:hypothetical protein
LLKLKPLFHKGVIKVPTKGNLQIRTIPQLTNSG